MLKPQLILQEVTAMKKNMGTADRLIRTILAIVVGLLYFLDVISGTTALILGILAVVFLLTSLVSTCPLYMPFGLSTRKR
ncbi:Protein of unknown function [Fodinibius sediminis]|uniref:Inner membrane protein YgaP-like transmembrane domain-containing protein n=2 Tax=Fodinibius sediminis TaxID=1214077 RepID=A0A521C8D2_9BACT|nr:Protein of unknown function [Fodinibius sediminis]